MGLDPQWDNKISLSELPPSVESAASRYANGSVIDLNTDFSNVSPGSDITSELQTAIQQLVTAGISGTIEISKSGTYGLDGAQQAGTVAGTPSGTYNYSGQILFPAQATSSALTIRIKGVTPAPYDAAGTGGVNLQTDATSGNVFDAIPLASNPYYASTGIYAVFEDISFIAPTNPQCGIVNGAALFGMLWRGLCAIEAPYSGTVPSGTLPALVFPPNGNGGMAGQRGMLWILGFPAAFTHYEHFFAEFISVGNCVNGAQPASSQTSQGHASQYERLLVQGTKYPVAPTGSDLVQLDIGILDIGDPAGGMGLLNVIQDPNNLLYGTIGVHVMGTSPGTSFFTNGGANAVLVPSTGRRIDQWPSDTFARISAGVAGSAGLGVTSGGDGAFRPWTNQSGGFVFNATSGPIKSSSASGTARSVLKYLSSRAGPSRIITLDCTTGATPIVYIIASQVVGGSNAGNQLMLLLQNNQVTIHKRISGVDTQLAASSALTVAAGAHTLQLVVSNTPGGSYTLTGILDGAQEVSYTLSSTDISQLTDTDPNHTVDGIQFYNDNTTTVSYFGVSGT